MYKVLRAISNPPYKAEAKADRMASMYQAIDMAIDLHNHPYPYRSIVPVKKKTNTNTISFRCVRKKMLPHHKQ